MNGSAADGSGDGLAETGVSNGVGLGLLALALVALGGGVLAFTVKRRTS